LAGKSNLSEYGARARGADILKGYDGENSAEGVPETAKAGRRK